MGKARDSQRSKLYRAEKVLKKFETRFIDFDTTVGYFHYITRRDWFAEHWPKYQHDIDITDGRGRRSACAYYDSYTKQRIHVAMPKFARQDWVALHEISHCVVPNDLAAHGPEFCGVFLYLVRHEMGKDAYSALKDSFDKHKVKYNEEWVKPLAKVTYLYKEKRPPAVPKKRELFLVWFFYDDKSFEFKRYFSEVNMHGECRALHNRMGQRRKNSYGNMHGDSSKFDYEIVELHSRKQLEDYARECEMQIDWKGRVLTPQKPEVIR